MYLRTGNLVKDFVIEPLKRGIQTTGRAKTVYDTESRAILRGVISSADPDAVARYDQTDHPCTHQIAQYGGERAKPGDRLVLGQRYYYILGVDNIGSLSIATLYYVEERTDLDDGSGI
mgnify:CR=1 FL=1